jgi:hypothetical protein
MRSTSVFDCCLVFFSTLAMAQTSVDYGGTLSNVNGIVTITAKAGGNPVPAGSIFVVLGARNLERGFLRQNPES